MWSNSLPKTLEVAITLKAGAVWVNCHNQFDAAAGFGGYKESGFGRDGGKEGLYEYVKLGITISSVLTTRQNIYRVSIHYTSYRYETRVVIPSESQNGKHHLKSRCPNLTCPSLAHHQSQPILPQSPVWPKPVSINSLTSVPQLTAPTKCITLVRKRDQTVTTVDLSKEPRF